MRERTLSTPDVVMLTYQGVIAGIVLLFRSRLDYPAAYLAINVVLVVLVLILAAADRRAPTRSARFAHNWSPVLVVPASFRELGHIIHQIHPYGSEADWRWDRALQRLDERWLGDVTEFFRSIASAPAADALTVCYWSYFVLPIILGAALYRPVDLRPFRAAITVLLVGWFSSYLLYFVFPARGPHLFIPESRAEALRGVLIAEPMHRFLLHLEGSVPDAFPSGHALVAMLVLAMAWRFRGRLFWGLLPFAAGLVAATMYLRYHYVIDVAASVLMLLPCIAAGLALHRTWEEKSRV